MKRIASIVAMFGMFSFTLTTLANPAPTPAGTTIDHTVVVVPGSVEATEVVETESARPPVCPVGEHCLVTERSLFLTTDPGVPPMELTEHQVLRLQDKQEEGLLTGAKWGIGLGVGAVVLTAIVVGVVCGTGHCDGDTELTGTVRVSDGTRR